MRYWLDSATVTPVAAAGGGVETRVLFGVERGCEPFEQRLLRFADASAERADPACDEVLYVLSGRGAATIAGRRYALDPGAAAFVGRGTAWSVERAEELEILSVLVRDPLPAGEAAHAVLAAGEGGRDGATAGREFTLLATPEVGCRSVTQFVGFIPVGRAPDHFHAYDEVVYVLEGRGELHTGLEASAAEPPMPGRRATPPSAAGGGESRPLYPGVCVHLPARLVHCLENVGPGEMAVLGVFRPAGSPAEAYYPDGTPAAVPTGED